VKIEFWAIHM